MLEPVGNKTIDYQLTSRKNTCKPSTADNIVQVYVKHVWTIYRDNIYNLSYRYSLDYISMLATENILKLSGHFFLNFFLELKKNLLS